MKKIVLVLFAVLSLISQTVEAEIVYKINKYGVMMVTFKSNKDSLTIDQFKLDWNNAVQIAENENIVKQIQLKDKNGDIIGWANKTNLSNLNNVLTNVIKNFSKYDKIEVIYYDSVQTKSTSTAKYRKDTYLNGEKISAYESDWYSGYFPTEKSSYRSGRNLYITITYYVAPKTEFHWSYKIKRNLIQKGDEIALKEIYIIR